MFFTFQAISIRMQIQFLALAAAAVVHNRAAAARAAAVVVLARLHR